MAVSFSESDFENKNMNIYLRIIKFRSHQGQTYMPTKIMHLENVPMHRSRPINSLFFHNTMMSGVSDVSLMEILTFISYTTVRNQYQKEAKSNTRSLTHCMWFQPFTSALLELSFV
jgi:hypothetical protein